MGKRKIRFGILAAALTIIGLFVLLISESWIYGKFPITCPLSEYFTKGSVILSCELEGFIDSSYVVTARGTKEDFFSMSKQILNDDTELSIINQPYVFVDGNPVYSDTAIKMMSNDDLLIDLYWNDGIITMTYSQF